jgi:CheY-like chemotaxis protein
MLHILLAEDNFGDILLVRQALELHKIVHELHIVRDGADALYFVTQMGQSPQFPFPDVVLMDLNLPKMDGPKVLSEFRKHDECVQTPVVVITSSDAQKDRARAAELGVTRYFKKPSDLDAFMELGALVREVALSETSSDPGPASKELDR